MMNITLVWRDWNLKTWKTRHISDPHHIIGTTGIGESCLSFIFYPPSCVFKCSPKPLLPSYGAAHWLLNKIPDTLNQSAPIESHSLTFRSYNAVILRIKLQ
jgi:hypothetical protein